MPQACGTAKRLGNVIEPLELRFQSVKSAREGRNRNCSASLRQRQSVLLRFEPSSPVVSNGSQIYYVLATAHRVAS